MVSAFLPRGPPPAPPPSNRLELVPDLLDSPFPGFVVRVEAELAARHETGPLSDVGFVDPFPEEGHLVLDKRELDLEFPLSARRTLCEELEQDPQTVVAFHAEIAFELVVHRGPKLAVEHNRVDPAGVDAGLDLLEFSAAHERAAVGTIPALDDGVDDPMARGRQEGRDFPHVRREGHEEDVQRPSEGASPP